MKAGEDGEQMDNTELFYLKSDLENRLQGMAICFGILTEDEKDIYQLLTRCKSVLDRIEPIQEDGEA